MTLSVLSMGWGVQTWTLAAMMALDEHPRADYIVFADTHHESQETYDFIRKWEPWLGEHGLTVVTVESENTDVVRHDWGRGAVMIPAFTVSSKTGKSGQVKRQCTHDWKIVPIRRFVRKLVKPTPGAVESWQGISLDEWHRMRDSDVKYIRHVYPLVDIRMTRAGCTEWLDAHELPIPPKSACTFCPYKNKARWKELKQKGGADWEEAVKADESIRLERPNHGLLYVHPARKPLQQAVSIPEDYGAKQLGFEDATCDSGYCFT